MGARTLFGRRVIYADVTEINDNNIIDVLQKALFTHLMNQADINYLYRYYKGDQPILYRIKMFGLKSTTKSLRTGPMRSCPSRLAT